MISCYLPVDLQPEDNTNCLLFSVWSSWSLTSTQQKNYLTRNDTQKASQTMFSKQLSQKSDVPADLLKESSQRRSILHSGIVIQGDWQSDGIVEFGGDIVGDLTVDVLIVKGSGRVDGNVRARSVTIEGYVDGTISALDVTLGPAAVFVGEIQAEKIRIDFGANVAGRLKTISTASA